MPLINSDGEYQQVGMRNEQQLSEWISLIVRVRTGMTSERCRKSSVSLNLVIVAYNCMG